MTSHHPCILGGFLDRYNIVVLTFDGGAFEHIFDLFSSTLMAFIVQTGVQTVCGNEWTRKKRERQSCNGVEWIGKKCCNSVVTMIAWSQTKGAAASGLLIFNTCARLLPGIALMLHLCVNILIFHMCASFSQIAWTRYCNHVWVYILIFNTCLPASLSNCLVSHSCMCVHFNL